MLEKPIDDRQFPVRSPEEFMARYAEAPVVFGEGHIPLSEYVAMEARFCPAPTEVREDPEKRLSFLAKAIVFSGQLAAADMIHLPPELAQQEPR